MLIKRPKLKVNKKSTERPRKNLRLSRLTILSSNRPKIVSISRIEWQLRSQRLLKLRSKLNKPRRIRQLRCISLERRSN
jgi:hypothetical protein